MKDLGDSAGSGGRASLSEAYRTVPTPQTGSWIRKFLAFAGPGYLVSVGYMDPGNWATDLAGGSRFGYTLIWVIFFSNLMAMFLQTLCARLGLVTGRDLAQACRDYYKKPAAIALWLLCEIAIIACDLAEVIGSAVALQLLFGIPLVYGVLITAADVLLLLGLMKFGFRKLEAIIITLVATVAGCFALEMFMAKPDWSAAGKSLLLPSIPNTEALLIAVGILGATVMPHNLYLHSSIVQTRITDRSAKGMREALKFNMFDTVIALGMAFFVNAAILVLAAAVFHPLNMQVEELSDAYKLLTPLLGGAASTAFAIALLASGQSSTITGTLAGQIVMEGFLNIKVNPLVRRLITRGLALIPALAIIISTGGKGTIELLILSQVVLSIQLSFATFPLLMFTGDKKKMGEYANSLPTKIVGYTICALIAALNVYLLVETFNEKVVGGQVILACIGVGMAGFAFWVMKIYRDPKAQAKS